VGKIKQLLIDNEEFNNGIEELRLEPEQRDTMVDEMVEHDLQYLTIDAARQLAKDALRDSYNAYSDSQIRFTYNRGIGQYEQM
jgi:hypothetical protein|tara:strand:- start:1604 stop:1852 length:249 start_codon:yes stop_codon:yes gene_type:complete